MPQPSLSDGATTINLQAYEPKTSGKAALIARSDIPERNGSILQFMGVSSEEITLTCYTTVSTDLPQLTTWRNAGTELTYNDNRHTSARFIIGDIQEIEPPSMQANYFEFVIVLLEVT